MIVLKMFVSLVTSSLIEVFEEEDRILDKLSQLPPDPLEQGVVPVSPPQQGLRARNG